MRSCVMGRGVEIFSSSSAMALASKRPTQMGSERLSSSSRRMSTGMLESGSSASPLTFISSHMVRLLVLVQGRPLGILAVREMRTLVWCRRPYGEHDVKLISPDGKTLAVEYESVRACPVELVQYSLRRD